MDTSWLSRTELLIGKENVEKLTTAHVLVVGMGGVGSYAAEFICRAGVGSMTIIDGDTVDPSNRNRQLPALATNHGEYKVEVMAERLKNINPELQLQVIREFVNPERATEILQNKFDYVVEAIDSITPKINFIKAAYHSNTRFVSSMGAGAKLDPTQLQVCDISKTYNCPFAQQIRKKLKEAKIYKGVTVVFSPEEPIKESLMLTTNTPYKKSAYGTISYLPATFGACVASVAIRELMGVVIK